MKEPVLVIMAAGMGSRYGGLKQIDPVGAHGELIIDYSIYDARQAGFRKVVCIIKDEMEADFRAVIGDRLSRLMDVRYAYQRVDDLPEGFSVPAGRVKPWGTGQAVLACRDLVDAPFAVINADDFYGAEAFRLIYDFLKHAGDGERYHYAMVGYELENTLTEHGHVARGVCRVDGGMLTGIQERTHIERRNGEPAYTEDGGESWVALPPDCTVSMNLWGFTPGVLEELRRAFSPFLARALEKDPLRAEFFLPTVVNQLLTEGRADVRVFRSRDRWYGVTYHDDKPVVERAIRDMVAEGRYPDRLWHT